jgi:hypothetical protein
MCVFCRFAENDSCGDIQLFSQMWMDFSVSLPSNTHRLYYFQSRSFFHSLVLTFSLVFKRNLEFFSLTAASKSITARSRECKTAKPNFESVFCVHDRNAKWILRVLFMYGLLDF